MRGLCPHTRRFWRLFHKMLLVTQHYLVFFCESPFRNALPKMSVSGRCRINLRRCAVSLKSCIFRGPPGRFIPTFLLRKRSLD